MSGRASRIASEGGVKVVVVSARGRLRGGGRAWGRLEKMGGTGASEAREGSEGPGVGGMAFFPLRDDGAMMNCDGKVFISCEIKKRSGDKRFWPMREGLGGKFGVVFSFAVVATDTELLRGWWCSRLNVLQM